MQRIVIDLEIAITIEIIRENDIVVYKTPSANTTCILTKISNEGTYGFINLSRPMNNPTFMYSTFRGAAKLALESGRELFRMSNVEELAKFI